MNGRSSSRRRAAPQGRRGAAAPGRPSKEDVVTEYRRRSILDAARRVLCRRGFAAATIDEIAAEAGLAKGTIYLYFRSKEALHRQIFQQAVGDLHERTRLAVEGASGTRAKVRAFVSERLRFFEEHEDLFRLYHSEMGHLLQSQEKLHEDFRKQYVAQVAILERALVEGAKRGEIRRIPADRVAHALSDLTRGLIVARILGPCGAPIEADADLIVDLLWSGLRCS